MSEMLPIITNYYHKKCRIDGDSEFLSVEVFEQDDGQCATNYNAPSNIEYNGITAMFDIITGEFQGFITASGYNSKGQLKDEVNIKHMRLVDNIKELTADKVKLSNLDGYKKLSHKEQRTTYKHLTDKGTTLYAEAKKAGYGCEKDGQYYLIKEK